MKSSMAGLVLLMGMFGVPLAQTSTPLTNDRPTHPGTAILDSMGIAAGAERTTTNNPPVHADVPAMPATPASAAGKQRP